MPGWYFLQRFNVVSFPKFSVSHVLMLDSPYDTFAEQICKWELNYLIHFGDFV